MPSWLLWMLKGLALGFVAATVNYYILKWGIKRMGTAPPKKANATLAGCYILRYVISGGTLFFAYLCLAKSTPFLVGTAFGLTVPNSFYLFKFLKRPNK